MSEPRKIYRLEAIGKHVVVELVKAGEAKSAGGIVLPDVPADPKEVARGRAHPLFKGTIVSIDPDVRLSAPTGCNRLSHPEEGDVVLMRQSDVATYHDPTSGRLYGFVDLDKIICVEAVAADREEDEAFDFAARK